MAFTSTTHCHFGCGQLAINCTSMSVCRRYGGFKRLDGVQAGRGGRWRRREVSINYTVHSGLKMLCDT